MDGAMWLWQEKKPSRIAFNSNLLVQVSNKSQVVPNLLALHLTSINMSSQSNVAIIDLHSHMTLMETVIWCKARTKIIWMVKQTKTTTTTTTAQVMIMQAFLTSISLHHKKKSNSSLSYNSNNWTSSPWMLIPYHSRNHNHLQVLNLISILGRLILPLLYNKIINFQMLVDFHSNSTKAKRHQYKLHNLC